MAGSSMWCALVKTCTALAWLSGLNLMFFNRPTACLAPPFIRVKNSLSPMYRRAPLNLRKTPEPLPSMTPAPFTNTPQPAPTLAATLTPTITQIPTLTPTSLPTTTAPPTVESTTPAPEIISTIDSTPTPDNTGTSPATDIEKQPKNIIFCNCVE